jgi:hypothetical protein
MNTIMQRTLLSAMMAMAVGAGTAIAATPEKDPGQKEPATMQSNNPSMQQSTPQGSPAAISAAAYDKFDALDVNHDGSIDKQEADASKALKTQFSKLDTNKDGKLSVSEFNNASNMAAIKVDNKDKGY